ncbi:MAG: CHAT domain-containing tetratricopeptide repeat protein [Bacteroidota bacterium]
MYKLAGILFAVLLGTLFSLSGYSQIKNDPAYKAAIAAFDEGESDEGFSALELLMYNFKSDDQTANYFDTGIEYAKQLRYFEEYDQCRQALEQFIQEVPDGADFQVQLGMLYHQLGVLEYIVDRYPESIVAYEKAIEIRTVHFGTHNADLANTWHNLGVALRYHGQFTRSKKALEKAVDIRDKLGMQKKLADSYNQLGIVCESLGDLERALENYQLAQSIYEESLAETDYWYLANCIRDIGIVYRKSDQPEKALPAFKEAQKIYINLYGELDIDVADSYTNLANCYDDLGDYELAIACGEEAVRQYQRLELDPSIELVRVYNILCAITTNTGQKEAARGFAEKALAQAEALEARGQLVANKASVYENLGDLMAEENPMLALSYYQQALQASTLDFRSDDILEFPDLNHRFLRERAKVLRAWYSKIQLMILHFEGRVEWLEAALDACIKADEIIANMHQSFSEESSSFFLSETARGFYDSGIQIAFALADRDANYLKIAFELAERGKSVVLLASQKDNIAMAEAGIPSTLIDRGQEIRQRIAYQENQLNELLGRPSKTSDAEGMIRQSLADLKTQWQNHIQELETQYSDYYRLKYATASIDLASIQSDLLDANTMLVEYFWGKDQVFVFMITANTIQTAQFPNNAQVQQHLEEMLRFLYRPDQSQYPANGFLLSTRLLGLVPSDLIQRLLIVPDGPLFSLPFEVLVYGQAPSSLADPNFPYWIRKWSIAYGYSAMSLALAKKSNEKNRIRKALGIAPIFKGTKEYATLAFSEQELDQLSEAFRLKRLLGKEAQKATFMEQAGAYDLLHLSTHAAVGDSSEQSTWIAFFPEGEKEERLSLNELYSLKLHANLVVLSACETGRGKLESSEGVMSLARGFAYAGCSSTLTTLWPVNHQSTVNITRNFYQELGQEQTKDQAIRAAKLSYLANDRIDALGKHPHYWAPYVLIGDTTALVASAGWPKPLLIWVLLPVVLLLGFVVVKLVLLPKKKE